MTSLRFYLGSTSKILNLSLLRFIKLSGFQNHDCDSLSLILQIIPKHFTGLQIYFFIYFFYWNLRACLVEWLEPLFSYFKQYYTLFHTLFHSHVYQKHPNNITQTPLPPLLTKA